MTKRIRTGLIFALLIFGPCIVFAQGESRKVVLDNGMVVLIGELPESPVAAIDMLIKTGAATEGRYLGCGISHFLEHMFFKGTEHKAVGEIADSVRALGGIINAATGLDYTTYTLELPSDQLKKGLAILADMMMHPRFDAAEVEKERQVILKEMKLHKDNPNREFSQLIYASVYTKHPYRHPVIGYEPLFQAISREDLVNYYQDRYAPNNMILSIAGGIDAEDTHRAAKEAFADFQPRPYQTRNLPEEPPQIAPRLTDQEYPTELTRLAIVYPSVSFSNPDMVALDILAMILGQGASSRLYVDLFKEKGLVYSIFAYNYTPNDKGLFGIECVLDEDFLDASQKAILRQIQDIKQKGVTDEELKKAKNQVLSRFYFDQEAAAGVAYRSALDEAIMGDYQFDEKYVQAIKQVTKEEVRRVAKEYLSADRQNIIILRPLSKPEEIKEESVHLPQAEIIKETFPNGMTVLLREDHAHPLVAVHLVLQGGLRQENQSTNGLSHLMSGAWTKGTKKYSSQDIDRMTESIGADLDSFSGRNSFGLSFSGLSKDCDFGLSLIEDIVKNATFSDEEILKEKEKVKSALLAKKDSVFQQTYGELKKTLFLTHPYGLDELGTMESVGGLKREDILVFYKKLAVANNMVLSVFGDFKKDNVLPMIQKRFAALREDTIDLAVEKETPPDSAREKSITMNKEQAMVMIGFQAPDILNKDRYPTEVLSSILGSSMSGRMFYEIRDEFGQAYTLGGSYAPGIDIGMVFFYVATTNEYVDKTKEILIGLIKDIQAQEVTDEELSATKTYLRGTHKMSLETNAELSFESSLDELYGLGFDYFEHYDESIDNVTKADIQRIAQTYLDPRKMVVVVNRSKEAK
ncbi:MAG: pitrilysin family protein [Candidatus Omnitrophota bacterium]